MAESPRSKRKARPSWNASTASQGARHSVSMVYGSTTRSNKGYKKGQRRKTAHPACGEQPVICSNQGTQHQGAIQHNVPLPAINGTAGLLSSTSVGRPRVGVESHGGSGTRILRRRVHGITRMVIGSCHGVDRGSHEGRK